eukprot:TRINITY_DN9646_c0_g1_i1.p1 TRINITY_DN9646_c0_g1~~TRINITY_DN9646_c0_g1_i1.p1  ORF type:complete len:758 (-),score=227.24 TRINITY_DN9646_c0_g1_i1:1994-4267(-)
MSRLSLDDGPRRGPMSPPRPTDEVGPARPTGFMLSKAVSVDAKEASSYMRRRGYYLTLTQGEHFNKFKHKRSVKRYVWIDKKLDSIHWSAPLNTRSRMSSPVAVVMQKATPAAASPAAAAAAGDDDDKEENGLNSLPLNELEAVVIESAKCASECELFMKRFAMNEACCLSLKFKTRTLDLECSTKTIRDDWASALVNVFLMGAENKEQFLAFDDANNNNEDDDIGFAAGSSMGSMELSPRLSEDGVGRSMKSPSMDLAANSKRFVSMDNLLEELKGEDFARVLAQGAVFKKYKKGKFVERYIWADGRMKKLFWGTRTGPGKRKVKGSINVAEIVEIASSPESSPSDCAAFKQRFETVPELCLSVIHAHRTVDLEAASAAERDRFLGALRGLIHWRDVGLGGDEFKIKMKTKLVLTKGAVFTKFNEKKGQERFIWVDTRLEKVYWGERKAVVNKSTGKFRPHKAKGYILVDDIKKIVTSSAQNESTSKAFSDRFAANEACCFSVDADGRFLDVEAASAELRDAWVHSLRTIVALGIGFEKKKAYMFDGEEGNEDLTDEDEGKVMNEVGSDEEPLNLPKILLNIKDDMMKSRKNLMKTSPLNDQKEALKTYHYAPISIDSKVEDFLIDLQCDIGADKSFLLKVQDNVVRPAWIEGVENASLLENCICHVGAGVIGKLGPGQTIILGDAYDNAEFDLKTFDQSHKYKTTSFLAVNFGDGKGVLCFANKQDMQFKKDYFQKEHLDVVLEKTAELSALLNW